MAMPLHSAIRHTHERRSHKPARSKLANHIEIRERVTPAAAVRACNATLAGGANAPASFVPSHETSRHRARHLPQPGAVPQATRRTRDRDAYAPWHRLRDALRPRLDRLLTLSARGCAQATHQARRTDQAADRRSRARPGVVAFATAAPRRIRLADCIASRGRDKMHHTQKSRDMRRPRHPLRPRSRLRRARANRAHRHRRRHHSRHARAAMDLHPIRTQAPTRRIARSTRPQTRAATTMRPRRSARSRGCERIVNSWPIRAQVCRHFHQESKRGVQRSQPNFAEALGDSVHTRRNRGQSRTTPEFPALAHLRSASRHSGEVREPVRSAA